MKERISLRIEEVVEGLRDRFGIQRRIYRALDDLLLCQEYCENSVEVFVTPKWYEAFTLILKRFGWNRKAINHLWDGFGHNWEHFWRTEEEKLLSADDWRDKFFGEIFYCYDRWSIDRILRAHWTYIQWQESLKGWDKIAVS